MKEENKVVFDSLFSGENKIIIEKPRAWPKAIALFVIFLLLAVGSIFYYKTIQSKNNYVKTSNENKIVSRPDTENTANENYDTYSDSWYPGKALEDLEKRNSTASNYVTVPLTGGFSIPTPESVISSTSQPNTAPSDDVNYGPSTQACLDMFSARTAALARYKQSLYDIQNQINNVEKTVRGRSSGYLMTEAQIQNAITSERSKLVGQYNEAIKEYNAVSAQYPTC